MAIFQYQALTGGGRLMKGTLEAGSSEQAQQLLTEMQLKVYSLEQAAAPLPRRHVGRGELLLFNQQLASITRSGIPLDRGLREIASDIDKPSMRRLVRQLADDLQGGMGIEEAFTRRQAMFPPLYGHIIKAGVQTGRLSEMLTSLNRHLEMSNQTRRILFESMTYPLVVLTLAAILLTTVFTFLIPPFRGMFADMGARMPTLTAFFLKLADNVVPFWLGVGGVIVTVAVVFLMLSASPGGRRFKESIYFRVPILGRLYHRSLMSRLSDAMALLIGAGCDLPQSLRLAAAAGGSETFRRECSLLADHLERGENIVEAGALCRRIPPLFFYSIQAGYQRNELQDNLYSLCDMYSQQARTHQSRLQGLLMPLMIIAVGGIIGLVIAAMFMPMVAMLQSVQGGK